jgi:hypothetical protein
MRLASLAVTPVPLPKGLESVAQPLATIAAVKAKTGIHGLVMALLLVMVMSPGGEGADIDNETAFQRQTPGPDLIALLL